MRIYLLRHASAEPRGKDERTDPSRKLTKPGIRKLRRVCLWLKSREGTLDEIMTSPYRRTFETAEIVSEYFRKAELRISPILLPEADPVKAAEALSRRPSRAVILCAGHEPFLGLLAGYLIFGEPRQAAQFKKSGLMRLTWDKPAPGGRGARLDWFVTPKLVDDQESDEMFGEDDGRKL